MHSLDRIDVNGHYEPSNCRWATWSEQNGNKQTTRRITHNGESLTVAEWARRTGVLPATIEYRVRRGWPTEKALYAPARH